MEIINKFLLFLLILTISVLKPSFGGKDSGEGKHKDEDTLGGFFLYRVRYGRIEYLLQKQTKDGEWSIPKGRQDPGETVIDTVIREMKEETGWDLGVDYYANFVREVYFEHVTEKGLLEKNHLWPAKLLKAKPIQLSEEHTDYVWLEIEPASAIVQRHYWSALQEGDRICKDYESRGIFSFLKPLLGLFGPPF